MGRQNLNEFITKRQEEARSASWPRPSPGPLEDLVRVVTWIFAIVLVIALVQAILSGQTLDFDVDGSAWP